MNDTDILAAWDEGAPPARDAAFRIATLEKLEARRFTRQMTLLAAAGGVGITAILVYAPQLGSAASSLPANTGLIGLAALSVFATAWGLSRAFGVKLI